MRRLILALLLVIFVGFGCSPKIVPPTGTLQRPTGSEAAGMAEEKAIPPSTEPR